MCTAKPRGKPVELGPAYFRRCIAARVAARQKALDLAGVVDSFEGNRNRKWRGDGSILNDDRRIPILWATTEVGLKYDCYSALLTVFRGLSARARNCISQHEGCIKLLPRCEDS